MASSSELLIQGLGSMAGAIAGRKDRRIESAAAAEAYDRSSAAYSGFEFTDPSAGLSNPYANLTVNQQQAQFQAQQQQQGLANALAMSQESFGGGGIAAATQSLLGQQSANLQQISGDIGRQESRNQLLAAQGQQTMQLKQAEYDWKVQGQEFDKVGTELGMAQARQTAAAQAKAKAAADFVGGLGSAIIGGVGMYMGMPPMRDTEMLAPLAKKLNPMANPSEMGTRIQRSQAYLRN